jgi:hypothetical protein
VALQCCRDGQTSFTYVPFVLHLKDIIIKNIKCNIRIKMPFDHNENRLSNYINASYILEWEINSIIYRGCPGWGANSGPLNFIYLLIITSLPLSHSGSPGK